MNSRSLSLFLDELREKAVDLGAHDAKIVLKEIISIEDEIIEMCKEPLCEGYNQSINCPPHAMEPKDFRELIRNYQQALLFKIDVGPEILLSEERFEAFRVIYEIAARLEDISVKAGFHQTKGFAAGSCKPVFCRKYQCQALIDGVSCRYPSLARPSIEAVGMNVFKLLQDVGWEVYPITKNSEPESVPSGLLAGLVLVA